MKMRRNFATRGASGSRCALIFRGAVRTGLAALCLAVLTATAQAGADLRGSLTGLDIPYEKFVLANGLTLIVHEDHKTPIVAVGVWYHVGSKDERRGHTGLAHLFEHLMFTSSENHHDEYFRPLLDAGATHLNGNTWLDRTTYFENVPVNALDEVLWLESDRMGHLLGAIDQHKLDEQRGVVENEKRQSENHPYGKVDEYIAASTYPAEHPYSWSAFGSMQDLEAASLEDVKSWFRTYYGAANAVLVIAGDVVPQVIRQKVTLYFGDIAPGPVLARPTAWIAKMSGERSATIQDRVPQPRLYETWNIPGYTTRDFTLLQLAADLLADGKNGRLYKRLVYADQLATHVSVTVGPFEIASQFKLIVTVRPGGDPQVVKKALDEELAAFLSKGAAKEDLERIKAAIFGSFVRRMERIDAAAGKAAILGESQLYGGSPDFYRQSLAWVQSASLEDVMHAAREWLSDGKFVLTVQSFPDYHAAGAGADRSRMPDPGPPAALVLPALQRINLSNGLKVVLAQRHEVPLVQLTLLVDAGHAADSLARPGTANLALALITEGTRTRNALQIAARAQTLGAQIEAGSTLDTSFISLSALTARLSDSLELFADLVLNPSFPPEQLARLKAQSLATIAQQQAQPSGLAARLFPRLIYGDGHAYSNPFSGIGSAADIREADVQSLRAFYLRWVRPDNATLLVTGDTTLRQIEPLLERQLGAWRAPDQPLPVKRLATVALPTRPRIFLVNRTAADQSLILAVQLAPPRLDPDDAAFQVVNGLLGGNFISRLNLNLREDKHWSYGAGSSLVAAKGQRPFVVSAMVQGDRTADAMREMLKELRGLLDARKPTEAEVRSASNTLVRALPGQNETLADLSLSLGDILTYGLPDDYLNALIGKLQRLTSQQVAAAAGRLIHPDSLTWIVVGDLAQIEPGVRALGWGEVQVLDVDGHTLR